MNEVAIVEIGREAIWVVMRTSAPIMMASLMIGLTIALFQALTTIQEMTLTFVPKILAIFASLIVFLPFMINTLIAFMNQIAQRIIGVT